MALLMHDDPDFAMPLTCQVIEANLTSERAGKFRREVLVPLMDAVVTSLKKHGSRQLKFPLLFAIGRDSHLRRFFWRAYLQQFPSAAGVDIATFGSDNSPAPPEGMSTDVLYSHLIDAAMSLKCPHKLAQHCYSLGVLDKQKNLLHDTSTHWFSEFVILALVTCSKNDMMFWTTQWPLIDQAILEARKVANMFSATIPTAEQEPVLWAWYCRHIFTLPVNNVIAERQFNISSLYLRSSESEMSKQATHLFVENILHNTQSRLGPSSSQSGRLKRRQTAKEIDFTLKCMTEYVKTVTPDRLRAACKQLKRLQRGESMQRSLTAAETYAGTLQRHKPRQRHAELVLELQKLGKEHAVAHNPGSRKATQGRAITRSFDGLPSQSEQALAQPDLPEQAPPPPDFPEQAPPQPDLPELASPPPDSSKQTPPHPAPSEPTPAPPDNPSDITLL